MPKDPQQQQAKRSILISSAPAETEPEPQYHLDSTQRSHSTQGIQQPSTSRELKIQL